MTDTPPEETLPVYSARTRAREFDIRFAVRRAVSPQDDQQHVGAVRAGRVAAHHQPLAGKLAALARPERQLERASGAPDQDDGRILVPQVDPTPHPRAGRRPRDEPLGVTDDDVAARALG